MSDWRDRGLVLLSRPFGDGGLVVHLLTEENGRHAGLFKGGRAARAEIVPGAMVDASWFGRLEDNLGSYRLEVIRNIPSSVIDDPNRLLAVASVMSVTEMVVQEREPSGPLFSALSAWLELLETPHWGETLVRFELGLLGYAGAGLDLSSCAATGATDDLIYVSPKSGRAVSAQAGAPYQDRLLPLPGYLLGQEGGTAVEGLRLTGHFIETRLCHPANRPLPEPRARLVERLADRL